MINQNALSLYDFKGHNIRTAVIDKEIWFVAKDICDYLEIKNHNDAISDLESDDKGVVSTDTNGGKQEMSVISESGLYALIFKSRKPEARNFTKWVTKTVLPSIRKLGYYTTQDIYILVEKENRRLLNVIDQKNHEISDLNRELYCRTNGIKKHEYFSKHPDAERFNKVQRTDDYTTKMNYENMYGFREDGSIKSSHPEHNKEVVD